MWGIRDVTIWHDGTESSKGWAPGLPHLPAPKPGPGCGGNHDPSLFVEDTCHSDGAYLPEVSTLPQHV